ncbi:HU family DNA-binding protein [Desulfurivibrio sp. D14AmB]|uniref:HU family DNA-binding protein n=1 Tax=Desulfurivibrio sp. D14AmB TaxID=3374370 RepID=UPI00376EBF34
MNKKELVEKLVAEGNMTKADAGRAIDSIFGAISGALSQGDKVALPGFGTLEVRERAAKQGRNPQTGEIIQVPARKAVAFKAGKTLKDAVNG